LAEGDGRRRAAGPAGGALARERAEGPGDGPGQDDHGKVSGGLAGESDDDGGREAGEGPADGVAEWPQERGLTQRLADRVRPGWG
jgi:hypothetical protein